jgi:hypothetical protein
VPWMQNFYIARGSVKGGFGRARLWVWLPGTGGAGRLGSQHAEVFWRWRGGAVARWRGGVDGGCAAVVASRGFLA